MADILTGLVGWWTMNQSSGTSIADASGNGNTGTFQGSGSPSWGPGKIGNALTLNSGANTDQYIDCGNALSLRLGSTGSVACWFKTTMGAANAGMVNKDQWSTDINGYGINWRSTGTTINCEIATAVVTNRVDSAHQGTYNDGQWHHACMTWDGSQLRLYIDGLEDPNSPVAQTITPASAVHNLNLFRSSGDADFYFDGSLDDVRVYNRALTQADVTALLNFNQDQIQMSGAFKMRIQ